MHVRSVSFSLHARQQAARTADQRCSHCMHRGSGLLSLHIQRISVALTAHTEDQDYSRSHYTYSGSALLSLHARQISIVFAARTTDRHCFRCMHGGSGSLSLHTHTMDQVRSASRHSSVSCLFIIMFFVFPIFATVTHTALKTFDFTDQIYPLLVLNYVIISVELGCFRRNRSSHWLVMAREVFWNDTVS